MSLVIRGATPADMAIVCEYNRLLAWESEAKALDPAVLQRGVSALLLDPAKGSYFLAEQGGRIIGQLAVTYEWSDWRAGWFWWVQSVYVIAAARRQGIFRQLLEHVQAEARRSPDVIGIRLYVERENTTAQSTYARLGLAPTSYVVMERYPLEGVKM
jgi:GNAT superfamily N-acetyltransferase